MGVRTTVPGTQVAEALAPIQAEDEALRRLVLEAIEIIRSDDFDRYFDLFADDAVWMMPSGRDDVGVADARKFYRFTAKFRFDQQVTVHEIVVTGDHAWVRLTFDGYLRAKKDDSAPPLRSLSRHVWILRRDGDGWKIIRDMWNNPRS